MKSPAFSTFLLSFLVNTGFHVHLLSRTCHWQPHTFGFGVWEETPTRQQPPPQHHLSNLSNLRASQSLNHKTKKKAGNTQTVNYLPYLFAWSHASNYSTCYLHKHQVFIPKNTLLIERAKLSTCLFAFVSNWNVSFFSSKMHGFPTDYNFVEKPS